MQQTVLNFPFVTAFLNLLRLQKQAVCRKYNAEKNQYQNNFTQ